MKAVSKVKQPIFCALKPIYREKVTGLGNSILNDARDLKFYARKKSFMTVLRWTARGRFRKAQ